MVISGFDMLTYCILFGKICKRWITDMKILNIFAYNMKKYRKINGLSQKKVAEKIGLHRTYINAIERERRNVSLENIQKIAEAIGMEAYQLFIDSH